MKYEKKDKLKVIVLLAVLVAVWAFIGIRFAVLSRQRKADMAALESRQTALQAVQAVQQGGQSAASPALRLAALVSQVEPPKDDPFRPVIAPRSHGSKRPSAGTPRAEPILPPSPDASGYHSSDLHLTGVIIGNPSTAVLRVADEHYIVHEGDWLDSRLRVQAIAQDKVTLRDDRSSYELRLGR